MYIQKLARDEHSRISDYISCHSQRTWAEAAYKYDLTINGVTYRLDILLLKKQRIATVQAVVFERQPDKNRLITDSPTLDALTKLLIDRFRIEHMDVATL